MSSPLGLTEFEILKASHKFLRDEDQGNTSKSWNEQLAEKYYENLYREFAVCDLKHYKSGNFALRWRTEDEVLSGAGETTCANTRCEHHSRSQAPLTTLELPFAYEEHGEQKSALVKVVLCERCVRKLLYKRNKEKREALGDDVKLGNDNGQTPRDEERGKEDEEKRRKRRRQEGNELEDEKYSRRQRKRSR